MFTYLNPHVNRTLTLAKSPARIILIERGSKRKLIDIKPTEENKKCLTSTGAERRFLQNHSDIARVLKDKYKDLFLNVILEDISLEEQIGLFIGAQIVIGQHGAGLCNIIWMTKASDAMVIEFPPFMCDTFKNMCSTMKVNYERMEPKPQEILKKCEMIKIK
jgi:capsular polysaccharide biosynthesis protein